MHVLASKSKRTKEFFRRKSNDDEPMVRTNDEPMDASSTKSILPKPETNRKTNEPVNKVKQRRGYGKKNKRKMKINKINLSLLGTNSAGLKSKQESLLNSINMFQPSLIKCD